MHHAVYHPAEMLIGIAVKIEVEPGDVLLEAIDRLGALDAVLPELVPLRTCTAGRDRPEPLHRAVDGGP